MLEVTHSCKKHRDTVLVGLVDGLLVTNAAARLNYCCDTIFCSRSDAVAEREETVGCEHYLLVVYVFAGSLE